MVTRTREITRSERVSMMIVVAKVVLLLIASFFLTDASGTTGFCPVSKEFSTTGDDHRYRYPIKMYSVSTGSDHETPRRFKCMNMGDNKTTTCLANKDLCPVRRENVLRAMKVPTWPQYVEAFRALAKASVDDTTSLEVNVFILGGSMTMGSGTHCGCMCTSDMDSHCKLPPPSPTQCNEDTCSWPTIFTEWLVEHFSWVKFNIFNFASSGANSKIMSDIFNDKIRRAAPNFTNHDIVFIDHSVNDASAVGAHMILLTVSFETLIRRVLTVFSTAGVTKPTVVVIEQYPHAQVGTKGMPHVANDSSDYAHTYREVSEHYNLVLWSVREVYWMYYETVTIATNQTEKLYQLSPFSAIHVDRHPAWYMHVFVADVLADSLLRSLALLVGDPRGKSAHTFLPSAPNSNSNNSTTPVTATAAAAKLPPPLYDAKAAYEVGCDASQPYLVDAHAESAFTPANLLEYETDPALAAVGWRQYIDHHATPGWMINDLSAPENRVLKLPITKDGQYLGKLLKIVYLRSYEGLGKIIVTACGYTEAPTGKSRVDGLFPDFEKVSLPDVYVLMLDNACNRAAPENRTVNIRYDPDPDSYDAVRAVHHRKFKIMSVELCSLEREV